MNKKMIIEAAGTIYFFMVMASILFVGFLL
jgi:hypothetical protein